MKYLLDTDHISLLQRRSGSGFESLAARMTQHSSSDFALSAISFHEQVLGAHTLINRAQNNTGLLRGYSLRLEILKGFSRAPVLPFDAESVILFDQMRIQKVRVATMDLRIAAIALSRNLTLLTRNTKDFIKVPDLVIEDWPQ